MSEATYITPSEQGMYGDSLADVYEEPSRLSHTAQEYGRLAAAVLLAGSAALGLTACEPGSNQTIEIGRNVPEKVLSKSGASITTGLCTETTQTVYIGEEQKEQKGHNCSPQAGELKGQTVKQVSQASEGNGHTFKGIREKSSCENPSTVFVNSLNVGDVISKQKKNYREYNENNELVIDRTYCDWQRH